MEEYSEQPLHTLPVLHELATVLESANKREELARAVHRIRKVLFEVPADLMRTRDTVCSIGILSCQRDIQASGGSLLLLAMRFAPRSVG